MHACREDCASLQEMRVATQEWGSSMQSITLLSVSALHDIRRENGVALLTSGYHPQHGKQPSCTQTRLDRAAVLIGAREKERPKEVCSFFGVAHSFSSGTSASAGWLALAHSRSAPNSGTTTATSVDCRLHTGRTYDVSRASSTSRRHWVSYQDSDSPRHGVQQGRLAVPLHQSEESAGTTEEAFRRPFQRAYAGFTAVNLAASCSNLQLLSAMMLLNPIPAAIDQDVRCPSQRSTDLTAG